MKEDLLNSLLARGPALAKPAKKKDRRRAVLKVAARPERARSGPLV